MIGRYAVGGGTWWVVTRRVYLLFRMRAPRRAIARRARGVAASRRHGVSRVDGRVDGRVLERGLARVRERACAFLLSKGVETPMRDGKVLSALGSKLVGTGIRVFYILSIVAVGLMVLSGRIRSLKK